VHKLPSKSDGLMVTVAQSNMNNKSHQPLSKSKTDYLKLGGWAKPTRCEAHDEQTWRVKHPAGKFLGE
jgi:hypothetical protein